MIPTLLDFLELVRGRKVTPRSMEEGCKERILSRLDALIQMCGREMFAVQRGFPIVQAVESGRLVVLDLRLEKAAADLLTTLPIYAIYQRRLHAADPFHQRPVVVVLDEARSVIRAQPHDAAIPDIELMFSRSRALGLGFFVAEQIVSAVSPAVLTACRLKLAFNTSPPELYFVQRYLGLTNEQAEEISRLPPGECIARLSGDRIPGPFRLKVPLAE